METGVTGGLTKSSRDGPWGRPACLCWLLLPGPWVSLFRGFRETHSLRKKCRKTRKNGMKNILRGGGAHVLEGGFLGYLVNANGVSDKDVHANYTAWLQNAGAEGVGVGGECTWVRSSWARRASVPKFQFQPLPGSDADVAHKTVTRTPNLQTFSPHLSQTVSPPVPQS